MKPTYSQGRLPCGSERKVLMPEKKNTVKRYRTKKPPILAVYWDGTNTNEVIKVLPPESEMKIEILEDRSIKLDIHKFPGKDIYVPIGSFIVNNLGTLSLEPESHFSKEYELEPDSPL